MRNIGAYPPIFPNRHVAAHAGFRDYLQVALVT
jgi:hypothetical protein